MLNTSRIIVGGDFNAWSHWWGSSQENARGAAVVDALNEMDLHILNEGRVPTFETVRGGRTYESQVDLTVCGESLIGSITNWSVLRDITSSDHNTIAFSVVSGACAPQIANISSTRLYYTHRADWSKFRVTMNTELGKRNLNAQTAEQLATSEDLDFAVNSYTDSIQTACNKSIPKIKSKKAEVNPTWWNQQLSILQRETLTLKRRIRCAAPRRREYVVDQYIAKKQEYTDAARAAQTSSWRTFCSISNRESMWDGIYRVLRHTTPPKPECLLKTYNGETCTADESVRLLADTLFPEDIPARDTPLQAIKRKRADEQEPKKDDDALFVAVEVEGALRDISPKKAPGEDHLTADICSRAIRCDMSFFVALCNACLRLGYFPTPWKRAVIKIIRKPNKLDSTDPRSYRPIGLLPVLGKILEKILVGRLRWHVLKKLSPRQYGFMPQRSTEDSLYDCIQHVKNQLQQGKTTLLISLDIQGAFDNAWWPSVRLGLLQKGCPRNLYSVFSSYLKNRSISVTYCGSKWIKPTTRGCIQGSVTGPTLWNVILDELLCMIQEHGEFCQAFADDIVLSISADNVLEIEQRANNLLAMVTGWGDENCLQFAPQKTKAIVVTRKRVLVPPVVIMQGRRIDIEDRLKLLGVIIDNRLSFGPHIETLCAKVAVIYKQIARAARVTWGLNPEIVRTIYLATIEPIILYAASVWAHATERKSICKKLESLQRGFAIKIAKAYRTTSYTAALSVAGILPLANRIAEAAQLYEVKRGKTLPQLKDRPIELRIPFRDAPHPAKLEFLQYKCLESLTDDTVSSEDQSGVLVYTDGSKLDGRVGAAYTIWRDGSEIGRRKLLLGAYCSVFQAELLAILEACRAAEKLRDSKVAILSDCRSALDTVCNPTSNNPMGFRTRLSLRNLKEKGKKVTLFWIRSHVGTEGNERADFLAKEATRKKSSPDYDCCPISYVKHILRQETLAVWQNTYEQMTRGKVISQETLLLGLEPVTSKK